MPLIEPSRLTPHERNTRIHSRAQIADLKRSILEFGFTKPIVVDENMVILAGHGAWEAACELATEGLLEKVAYHKHAGLTQTQKRAYIIADNRLGELSKWDRDALLTELQDLELDPVQHINVGELFAKKAPDKVNVTLGANRFLLQVEATTEAELRNLYDDMTGRGLKCKILS